MTDDVNRNRAGTSLLEQDPTVAERYVQAIRLGAAHSVASRFAGVSSRTTRAWRETGREQKEAAMSTVFTRFIDSIEEARGQQAITLLARIERAAATQRHWTAAAWLLERVHGMTRTSSVNLGGAVGVMTWSDIAREAAADGKDDEEIGVDDEEDDP
jgi:hypothetical protein